MALQNGTVVQASGSDQLKNTVTSGIEPLPSGL
jgi:hypothetical protein